MLTKKIVDETNIIKNVGTFSEKCQKKPLEKY
jgi:hypothetical protein